MKLFLCKRADRWQDPWTYGDWRQWLCRRPDGAIQCARLSMIPLLLGWFGCGILLCFGMALAIAGFAGIIWIPNSAAALALAAILIGFNVWLILTRRDVMVAVGPRQYRDPVEGFRRILPGEVE